MKKLKKLLFAPIVVGALFFLTYSCNEENNDNEDEDITVTDIDGNIYHTLSIGTQVWMVENLKTTRYRNGDQIPYSSGGENSWENLTTGVYCNYNDDINNVETYGRLYNWAAIIDSRNLCPVGWHIPNDNDWNILINNLGGREIAGGKLKEIGISHWISPNTGATNEYMFSALPSGSCQGPGGFDGLGFYCGWWSSTPYIDDPAWGEYIDYNGLYIHKNFDFYDGEQAGLSVRCIKD